MAFFHRVSTADQNAANVKAAGGGILGGIIISNTNAAIRFLKLYDKATAPVPATDTPVYVVPVGGNTSGAVTVVPFVEMPFVNGIGIAITGGVGDNDNTAIGANDCVVSFLYH